jgi:hypothetical protein
MNKSVNKKMVIPKNIADELDAMQAPRKNRGMTMTNEQKAVLLKYWTIKDQKTFVAWFKKKYGWGSHNTLLRKYRELTR